jgi:hypothetical protein
MLTLLVWQDAARRVLPLFARKPQAFLIHFSSWPKHQRALLRVVYWR